ncbi:methylenetetrahydrofolate--tRNA-(uracil(54)-C(5))-methyltransferase (FADH(2)-oxidizing) TrmFO [Petroclostridium sp. X23]|uniref:methylenetetrahydrofolate--tRNA-(uracil(54)- C(5))-methyltransferase (FADH(2)-oxidizing) TrmFO n=1 Tax=Petroclostridium sp. X23 TaxID=3045146 RepID=UPI0024AE74EB|nr:methylenetetrahydrofolate--tRNA-(uracil(54)-C(5))-methyltransferase (FADH(2)-oxidizing) TrmFO [Petroclostridium sp. X23]WHH58926.1 methylenetetrahydrofolate--tRNA-(uracil(54)-C(5))-methyltransferase (FADH(2)-oxidizing) TrmFO [Petroclostridium sp. X23]
MTVTIIGGGLAGCEAAWQLAKRGISVKLYEMKPEKYSDAHHSPDLAELVCSNSLRSDQLENAVGLLKQEMRIMGSLIMACADATRVPAGGALAVDRNKFSRMVTEKVTSNERIEVIHEEIKEIPQDEYVIIASGPLTSETLSQTINAFVGDDYLYFYDAAAPIVTYESIDKDKVYKASRYGKGDDDYINCPMNQQEYERFWNELVNGEIAELKCFEKEIVFEGCMPVETMAKRGKQTLLFGPLKPVGLVDPKTGQEPYAVIQLRQDNNEATLYNIVGFQTHLKWGEQKRVFQMIPGLENAEFMRYGVMHRNTFINSPRLLNAAYQTNKNKKVFFAGQITGVEGYIESASSGLVAGINMARLLYGKEMLIFPKETAHGGLSHYISDSSISSFQPMNINFGLIASLNERIRNKKEKNTKIAQRAISIIEAIANDENNE